MTGFQIKSTDIKLKMSYTLDYVQKRFGNLIFQSQKAIELNFFNQKTDREERIKCSTFICNILGLKPTIGLLLVPYGTNLKSGTLESLPWFQFQVRTYENMEQVERAIGSFIVKIPFGQEMIQNNFEEPPVELYQTKHDDDRIRYNVEENQVSNPGIEVILFSKSNQDIDGVNLDPVVNLCDALEDLNFCVHRLDLL